MLASSPDKGVLNFREVVEVVHGNFVGPPLLTFINKAQSFERQGVVNFVNEF